MTNLQRRLKKLEARSTPPKHVRLLVRYEGFDWEDPEDRQDDIDENDPNAVVLTVQYVDMPRLEDR